MGSLRCVLQRWGWADTVLRVGVHLYEVRIWNSSGFPKKMRMGTQNDMEQKELRDPELSIAWFTIQNWSSVFSMLLLFALRGSQTKTCEDTQLQAPWRWVAP